MYRTRAASLPNLYIRNINPMEISILFAACGLDQGGAMRYSSECVEWGFSEVRG